jgi:hypothetical protein
MEDVARLLLGPPNKSLSSKTELRFGNHGSLSVDLSKGIFHDFSEAKGGGVLDLIFRETGKKGPDAVQWLRDQSLDVADDRPAPPQRWAQEPRFERERPPAQYDRQSQPRGTTPMQKPTAVYQYTDESGELAFEVCRFESVGEDGKVEKTFRQRRRATSDDPPEKIRDGWIWSVKGVRQVPYRIADLIEAVARETIVFVVEGEKDVENLAKLGIPATCNAMGAGKWPEELNAHFRGANVVILPDNDEPGRNHRDLVARSLAPVAASVRVLDLPGLGEKGDVSDWLAAGGTVDKFYDLVETKAWRWSEASSYKSHFQAVRWADLDKPGLEHEWLIKGLLTRGERSMVAGPSQSGKSFAVLDLALSVARGVDYKAYSKVGGQSGWEVREFKTLHGGVVYQAGEGGRGLKKRLRAYREHHGLDGTRDLPFVLLPSAIDLFANDDHTNMMVEEIRHWASTFTVPLELIVIDTLSAATPGANENTSEDMSRVLARCEKIAQATKAHVMIVHHMNAAGAKPRGHTSIFANLDNALEVRKVEGLREPPRDIELPDGSRDVIPGREVREIVLTKQKDGEDGTQIRFVLKSVTLGYDADGERVSSCVVVPPSSIPGGDGEHRGRPEKISNQAFVFLKSLRKAIEEQGQPPPPSLGLPASVRVVTGNQMAEAFYKATSEFNDMTDPEKKRTAMRKAISRHGDALVRRGIIARENPYVWLLDKPVEGFKPLSVAHRPSQQPPPQEQPPETQPPETDDLGDIPL